jgi:hypothetical protein
MMTEQIHQKNILERRKKIMMMIPIPPPPKNQNHHIIKNSRKFIDSFFKIKNIIKFKYD